MAQNTNLNVTPYYDDFDKDRNFYRVLFRPGFPIQARELSTMQSILQNQVESVGSHLFKDGAMVIPGQVGYDLNVQAILLQESFLGSDVETYRTQLTGTIIEGLTTGVKAKVLYSISASESERGYVTLYVKYIDSGDTTSESALNTFQINEQLIASKEITFGTTLIEIGTPFAQLLPVNATAVGSTAYISDGVYFIRGHFVNVPSSYLILNQYDTNPSYRIGLEILESIITPEDDESLNDNAAGTSNYSAPGAHRFKIGTQFVKRLITDEADKNFIELLRINNSNVESFVERTAYSELEKSMARRTYEESGDYVIDTFDVTPREHLNDGFNNGVYSANQTSSNGNLATDSKVALEVSPGTAYVRGYRTEFITPQYIDVDKPRDFDTRQNGIINFNLGNFLKVYDVYGWPEVSGDGVTDAYQILDLYDDYAANATSSVKAGANRIGRCRTVQLQKSSTALAATSPFGISPNITGGVYDLWVFDVQMFTVLNIANAVTPYTAGTRIVGKTSGAAGYIADTGNGSHYIYLEQVNGVFINSEILEVNGRTVGTLEAAWSYQLSDTRSCFGKDSGSNIIFGSNFILNDSRPVEASTVDIDDTTDDEITGFRTRFEKDLRPGDVVTPTISDFEGVNTHRILRVDPTAIATTAANKKSTVSAGNEIFDFAEQTAKIDGSLLNGTVTDGEYSELIRLRPFIFQKDYQNGELSFDLPEDTMKSLDDESFFVYRNFSSKTVTTGSITFTVPETESFAALSSDNYVLTVVSNGGSGTYSNGQNIDIDAEVDAANLTASFGANNQSFTVSGLGSVATVTLTALVSKNTVSKKLKTASKMQALKVFKTVEDLVEQPTGLTFSALYGTRVEDEDLSFGIQDVYRVHAVYESYDENDASAPYVVLTESVFFAGGTLIIGKTSGARGRVISFSNADLKLYYVGLNDIPFVQGETINGFNSANEDITGIIDDSDSSIFAGSKVVTNQFELEAGQKTNYYDVSRLRRLSTAVPPTRRLLVIFDYFAHASSGDYFSSQSYSGINFKEIPNYKLDGSIKFIRDQIDFRPGIKNLRNGSGTISAPYFVNCTTFDFVSRVFDNTGSTIFDIMQVNSSFRADYAWYLPRIDKLFLSHDGALRIAKGVSGYYLIPPADVQNSMLLATIEYKPYVFDPERDILITPEVLRRYTMKDIGDIEQRLTHVEYYTSLSMLESQADNTKTYDENGFDRLKNGYVVDDFTDHTTGDVLNVDYKCSLDFREGQLRPQHYTTNVGLRYNPTASTNVVRTNGNVVMLPFDDVAIVTQPYASRTENVNPFNVFTFIGRVDLTPASDDWIDIERLPARVENVEGDFSAVSRDLNVDQNGFAPIQWQSWQTTWKGETIRSRNRFTSRSGTYGVGRQLGRAGHGQRRQGLFYLHERRTIRVVNNQARQGIRTRVIPKIEQKSLGDTILSRTVIPWIRSRNIGFNVDRMKPRTRFYAFFDGDNVTNYITPKVVELIKNSTTDNRTNETPFVVGETVTGQTSGCQLKVVAPDDGYKTNPYGKGTETLPTSYSSQTVYLNHDITEISENISPNHFGNVQVGELLVGQTSGAIAVVKDRRILTDNVGNVQGTLFIPSPKNDANPRWATGTRSLRFTTSETNLKTPGTVDSSAQTTYSATGTLQTVRENILAVRNAEIVTDTVSEERVVQTTRTETRQVGWYDPLAQSFIIEEEGGMFLTGVDIFFNTKDANIPISMQIRTMENGYPTKTILPFSDVTITPDDIEISESAAVPSRFSFKAPVYIKSSVEYCFVLLSDSNEYQVWISRMGDVDVTGTRTISEQPYAGVLFKSQNASTWTADQYEDLKFTIYRANFTSTTGTVTLENAPQGKGNNGIHRLIENPIQTIKPKQVLSLGPAVTQYTFSQGARLLQQTTAAQATIISTTTSSSVSDTLTINDASGSWLQGTANTYLVRSSESLATIVAGSSSGTLEVGDIVTGATSNSVGIVKTWDGSTNLVLHYITGAFTDTETLSEPGGWTATVTSSAESGDSYGAYLTAAPTFDSDQTEVLVYHQNHGMYNRSNNVSVEGVISEISPTTLTGALAAGATSISVLDANTFHTTVNGSVVSGSNPGYIRINSELIQYSAISSDGKTITVATSGRGSNSTTDTTHPSGSVVECYNLDGIPLIDINKTHTSVSCPWLDTYMLHITGVANSGIRGGGINVYASQNIQFETLTPSVSVMDLPETDITARVNTTSATSIGDGSTSVDQASFVNDGSYVPVTLNDLNLFNNPRMICSEVNELAKLSGQKSFTMKVDLSTEKDTLSPVVDLDRCSLITTSNRINQWPGGPDAYGQQSQIDTSQDVSTLPFGDRNDAVYITRLARLIRESRSLRIDLQMSRPPEADVRIYYRAFSSGTNDDFDSIGWTLIDTPLQYDASPNEEILWKDYYYEVSGLNFNAFQIKIVMRSSNQARVPLIADLRCIALAT
ncbi:virulence associated protein [Synechococcus phage S-MbCM100]|uniref:Virion structural protein n=2 Tax=Acionnavirus monteraybay TaxID=2734078 RepID=A0A0E3HYD1_9CAUD|nr:virulence associated protein [Synechococcus phage S-MbCM100]AIX15132.1 virion structural protein [Synechococcus phage ACG-2014a]AHB80936.1 virulence associated protein [Synechococcus phage S-MbCM100]AIX16888.1 virion structural protein [Synechococcus phage ACG-2014a]AIX17096.1 virion structural protein [Synechococcus phage ACG-2014a]AIX23064.1 virion structural protein [Synechococcus phage ACG-2014a]